MLKKNAKIIAMLLIILAMLLELISMTFASKDTTLAQVIFAASGFLCLVAAASITVKYA